MTMVPIAAKGAADLKATHSRLESEVRKLEIEVDEKKKLLSTDADDQSTPWLVATTEALRLAESGLALRREQLDVCLKQRDALLERARVAFKERAGDGRRIQRALQEVTGRAHAMLAGHHEATQQGAALKRELAEFNRLAREAAFPDQEAAEPMTIYKSAGGRGHYDPLAITVPGFPHPHGDEIAKGIAALKL